MAVWCRQSVDGVPDPPYLIAKHTPRQRDAALLAVKAKSAAEKGWIVEWTSHTSFTATKVRWQSDAVCVREFWAE